MQGLQGLQGTTGPVSSVLPTTTTTDLGNSLATVNTTGKALGKMVYNTSTNLIVVAAGSGALDNWYPSDGGSAITPA